MGENIGENELDEWKTIRELVSSYDDRKHELRKTGFSLITSLIAAQGIIIWYHNQNSINNINNVDNLILTAVLGVTIALIFAIAFYEKGYRLYQEAAVQRALLLEKKLNLQLTETISYQFKSWQSRIYEFGVYGIFIGSALALAFLTIPKNNWEYPITLSILTGVGILAMLFLSRDLKNNYRLCTPLSVMIEIYLKRFLGWIWGEKKIEDPHLDWSIDPLVCKQGEKVAITLTNLNKDNSITEFVIEKDHPNLGNLKKDLDLWYDKTKVVFFKCEHVSGWRSKLPFFKCPLSEIPHKKCNETPKHCHVLFKIMHEEYYSRYYSSTDILHSSHKKCYGNGNRDSYVEPIPSRFQLEAGASRTWLWNTIGFEKGIYIVCTPYNTPEILTRKIRII